MSYREYLSQYDRAFQDSEEAGGANDPLPDGSYQVTVYAVRLTESKEKRRPMLEWELVVISGTYEGKREWLRQLLDNPKAYPFVKRNLRVCGAEIQRLSELPDVLDSMLDKKIEITIKTTAKDQQEYRNVYFDRSLSDPGTDFDPGADDNVPF